MRPTAHFPMPPVATSPFRNTTAAAEYVGSSKCVDCHPGEHASYLKTAHSRALAEVVAEAEPPDAVFDHRKSQRRYRVERRDGQLWHCESVLFADGREQELSCYPLEYRVGSGHFGRTYLAEADGFLIESPITWFEQQRTWGMSPGYDSDVHHSFTRYISTGCLFCHSGNFHAVDGNEFRIEIVEHAIGCERCHGPGSLHVARHMSGEGVTGGFDDSIVNPRRLSRELSESICQQCHLQGDVGVEVRGRTMHDFRPGLPLQDFRVDYREQTADSQMTVVGHVEQMHLSRCYQESQTLTCLTCHHPHNPKTTANRRRKYIAVCLDCHAQDSCQEPLPRRVELAENDCVQCHMPQSPTEVPHIAFTHHRIGVHSEAWSPDAEAPAGSLATVHDLSHLPEAERQRLEGLAYAMLAAEREPPPGRTPYAVRAIRLLRPLYEQGLREFNLTSALADILWHTDQPATAEKLAREALALDAPYQGSRVPALTILAELAFQRGDYEEAAKLYRELTEIRRTARDWFFLGLCEQNCGRTEAALEALQHSLEIDPGQSGTHGALATLYHVQGNRERERYHREQMATMAPVEMRFGPP